MFWLDGDTIEQRVEQAISDIQVKIEQQEKEIQYHREEIKKWLLCPAHQIL